ncbi:MAG: phytanoyl-CoA dioxygenase family protein [Actinomycetota bacterium]|nr:phytanoyl-CoA dioxygenase family protein [Actinomycetota bacterium]
MSASVPVPSQMADGAVERTMTADQRRAFEELGYLVVPGAIPPVLLDQLRVAVDQVCDEERRAGRLGPASSLHLLGFLGRHEAFLELLDLPATFPLVWTLLGWNIYVYHSHLDVHPPAPVDTTPVWGWHQDGGRQNLELETAPRPMLSLKVAFWLSDVSQPGRGNTLVIPGSHHRNGLPRPDDREHDSARPAGAVELLAKPGDAVLLDRRLWHSRSVNGSAWTRRALFLAFTYRWVRERDQHDSGCSPTQWAALSPIRQQLLGKGADPESFWGLGDDRVPLYDYLRIRGLLDMERPSHR